jgi:hypothetical protein
MNISHDTEHDFAEPPFAVNGKGEPRRVGVELEMAGIRPEDIEAVVIECFGGILERRSAFVSDIRDTEFGDFRVELDSKVLTNRGYLTYLADLGIDIGEGETRDNIELVLSRIAGLVVPLELVAPPIPWTSLGRMDTVRSKLREAGAHGTQFSALYAFGMQLNVEAASLSPRYLLAMLRAFLSRYEWLQEREQVDLSRKLSSYVQPYPEDYVAHIMQADYAPDIERLIDDFLEFTPTRNRPLDMLPLFAHIDEARVMAAPVERELIKPRPAFHYRLPNCLIDEPNWSLSLAWNDWVEVERLAADPERLKHEQAQRLSKSSDLERWFSGAKRWLKS